MALINTSWPAVALTSGKFEFDSGGPINNSLQVSTGTFVATGSSVTVANTAVTASSQILFTLKTVGGTVLGLPYCLTITAGTGFTVNAGASDTSTYSYAIIG